ncbi:hypothetical protein HKBW3S09_01251 [Candidatus Hakubella thermalkaliphila]|uniref:Uncharacterized protein n=1 Tax=Candidatus Hakubella thermalkaliphila TaxID=2754717 RepID=A0A6V8NZ28_9ACTN|nr:hypothetical protein HKBW3S09_01251 [Candidatus Hakubella thermalkaliphila]
MVKPRYTDIGFIQIGGKEQRIVGPFLEFDHYIAFCDFYVGGGIDKVSEDMSGFGILIAVSYF